MATGLFIAGLLISTATATSELEVNVDYRLRIPREFREVEMIPTPFKLVSPVSNSDRKIISSGYGPRAATYNPPVNVLFDPENFDFQSAEERNHSLSTDYQAGLHIGLIEDDLEVIESTRLSNVQAWQQAHLNRSPRLEFGGKVKALLSGDQNSLQLQMAGSPVFFPGYDQNYRHDIPIDRREAKAGDSRDQLDVRVTIGAVLLEEWEADWDALTYHFFRNSIGVNHSVLDSSTPSIHLDSIEDYLEIFTRHKEGGSIVAGMEQRGNTYYGYVHSNCVEFSDRGDEESFDYDAERLCWQFDRRQAGRILPLLASSPSSSSRYVVERRLVDASGDESVSSQEISLLPSYFVNLQEIDW